MKTSYRNRNPIPKGTWIILKQFYQNTYLLKVLSYEKGKKRWACLKELELFYSIFRESPFMFPQIQKRMFGFNIKYCLNKFSTISISFFCSMLKVFQHKSNVCSKTSLTQYFLKVSRYTRKTQRRSNLFGWISSDEALLESKTIGNLLTKLLSDGLNSERSACRQNYN